MNRSIRCAFALLFIALGNLSAQQADAVKEVANTSSPKRTYRVELGYTQPYQRSANFRGDTYFHGGKILGTVDFHIPYNMAIETGLGYSLSYGVNQQHYTTGAVNKQEYARYQMIAHTIDLPIRLSYTQKIWSKLALFAYAGPNLQFGVAMSQNTTSTLSEQKALTYGVVVGKSDLYGTKTLNRFNLQLGVGGGVQWGRFRLKSGYEFGMLNLHPTLNMNQSGWYTSFSYAF